jgi:hypothetical protein
MLCQKWIPCQKEKYTKVHYVVQLSPVTIFFLMGQGLFFVGTHSAGDPV